MHCSMVYLTSEAYPGKVRKELVSSIDDETRTWWLTPNRDYLLYTHEVVNMMQAVEDLIPGVRWR